MTSSVARHRRPFSGVERPELRDVTGLGGKVKRLLMGRSTFLIHQSSMETVIQITEAEIRVNHVYVFWGELLRRGAFKYPVLRSDEVDGRQLFPVKRTNRFGLGSDRPVGRRALRRVAACKGELN